MPSVSARCAWYRIWRYRLQRTSSPSPTRRSVRTTSNQMPNVRFDAGLTKIASKDDWRVLAEGLGFTEGPVWHHDGYLLFSDIPNTRIHRVRDGELGVYREPSGQSNGLTFDRQMRLLACEHENRRVSRENAGSVPAIAPPYDGQSLNRPHDTIVPPDARLFFTDPPYGIHD